MIYDDFEKHLSKARMDKYKRACGGNEQKAIDLYMQNIEISKTFYAALSFLEIALRNAINNHYQRHFEDNDWITTQAGKQFFSEHKKADIRKAKDRISNIKPYSSDNLVAELGFGFWISMFSSHCFNQGNQTLLKILPNKEKGINHKLIYKELDEVRIFRNRIAHYEPICFNESGKISVKYMEKNRDLIIKHALFLGLPTIFLQNIMSPISDIEKLREFFSLTAQV